jgi:AAHS family 4-hydroxybenzoate transporter-like MFS transporter
VDSANTRALTVNEIIDERPLSRFQISTIALCGLVLLLDGFDTQCIGFLRALNFRKFGHSPSRISGLSFLVA